MCRRILVALMVLGFAGPALAQLSEKGVLFPIEYKIPWMVDQAAYSPRLLTSEEAAAADRIAVKYLKALNHESITPNIGKYRRQYFGIKRLSNHHACVWINFFFAGDDNSAAAKFPRWRDELVEVKDGGANYFNIKVDLETEEAYDLFINGEA